MIKAIDGVCNYFKYGKVVHRSPNGNVIRKKTNLSMLMFTPDVETTKTVLNKDNQVLQTLNRQVYKHNDESISLFNVDYYDANAQQIVGKSISREYEITPTGKKITDFTKPNGEFQIPIN
ncbi:MAG: hypothetical protein K6E29_05835 [Cyanobacteria bacterium RUI128]|nr:hypothetical protein [Cyanobacteria bacterium RUI128]